MTRPERSQTRFWKVLEITRNDSKRLEVTRNESRCPETTRGDSKRLDKADWMARNAGHLEKADWVARKSRLGCSNRRVVRIVSQHARRVGARTKKKAKAAANKRRGARPPTPSGMRSLSPYWEVAFPTRSEAASEASLAASLAVSAVWRAEAAARSA